MCRVFIFKVRPSPVQAIRRAPKGRATPVRGPLGLWNQVFRDCVGIRKALMRCQPSALQSRWRSSPIPSLLLLCRQSKSPTQNSHGLMSHGASQLQFQVHGKFKKSLGLGSRFAGSVTNEAKSFKNQDAALRESDTLLQGHRDIISF